MAELYENPRPIAPRVQARKNLLPLTVLPPPASECSAGLTGVGGAATGFVAFLAAGFVPAVDRYEAEVAEFMWSIFFSSLFGERESAAAKSPAADLLRSTNHNEFR